MKRRKISLLYAEDEANVRENYVLYMKIYFDKVYEAKDGKEAWDLYKEHKPDVVIMDIEMPLVDGLEIAERIREENIETKIIMLTAHSDKERLLKAIKLNLVDYLVKPINRVELRDVLEKTLALIELEKKDLLVDLGSNIKVDMDNTILYKDGSIVELTSYELKLLKLFLKRKNQVVSKDDIYNNVWDIYDKEFKDSGIRNLVKKLRKKLPEDIIHNVYGSGYIFKL